MGKGDRGQLNEACVLVTIETCSADNCAPKTLAHTNNAMMFCPQCVFQLELLQKSRAHTWEAPVTLSQP